MVVIAERKMPEELLNMIISRMGFVVPHNCHGIKITDELIKVTVECLNDAPLRILPQNCRNDVRSRTPDSLDLRIKNRMGFDLRTANIISNILAEAGIVEVIHIINQKTGRRVKATQLFEEWTW